MKYKKVVAIVDDQYLFRKGFKALLYENANVDVLFEAENGVQLLEKLKVQQPEIIFLDIDMPEMDGIEATDRVRAKYPNIKIIILTSYYEENLALNLMERGANAFLSKNTNIEIIIKAINSVMTEGYYFDFLVSKVMAKGLAWSKFRNSDKELPKLSKREVEVVKLICKQHTNNEIASIMSLSPRTIDTYRENILNKTGAKNIVGIALFAFQHRLIDV